MLKLDCTPQPSDISSTTATPCVIDQTQTPLKSSNSRSGLLATAGNDDKQSQFNSQLSEAKNFFANNRFDRAKRLSEQLLKKSPHDVEALAVNICSLVELKEASALFYLSHKLVNEMPDSCISWYAVGCYYYTIAQYESAKRYLAKCTGMLPAYGPGWIVFGHAFAAEREHDQAMNCYIKAAKVLPDSHLPLLYNGLEYSLTNNLKLSEKFLDEAMKMKKGDPFVLHELGVLAYRQDNYPLSDRYLRMALDLLFENPGTSNSTNAALKSHSSPSIDKTEEKLCRLILPAWEPLINNLGHVARKLNRLDEALMFHRKALSLCPRNASTYASIGLVHLMKAQLEDAITMFHRSLAINNDNAQLRTLLAKVLVVFEDHPQFWSQGDNDCPLWIDISVPNPIRFTECETGPAQIKRKSSGRVFVAASELNCSSDAANQTNLDQSTSAVANDTGLDDSGDVRSDDMRMDDDDDMDV